SALSTPMTLNDGADSGLQRLGLAAGHRTPKTTPDAPPIPDRPAQPRGVEDGESGAGRLVVTTSIS
ncbi:MAG: hypothetical protein NTZ94_18690, partial [Verrucomicrobia bacterium]|nr:hypothetical protein [Verrucomicrobiota bacterium]